MRNAFAAEIVTDEATRLRILGLVFPAARISRVAAQPDKPFEVRGPRRQLVATLRNALLSTQVYEVFGPPKKEEEDPASDILREHGPSQTRQVHMKVFRWSPPGGSRPMLVAILSYQFRGANPPRCCSTIGKVLLLSNAAERIVDSFDSMPWGFSTFTEVRFLNDGSGSEKLMIGVDASGAATLLVDSAIFDLSKQKLTPVLSVQTMVLYEAELENIDVHALTLDETRTRSAKGTRYFFVKRTFADKKKLPATSFVTTESYPAGTGLPLDWQ